MKVCLIILIIIYFFCFSYLQGLLQRYFIVCFYYFNINNFSVVFEREGINYI
jgi:hypothetical protein